MRRLVSSNCETAGAAAEALRGSLGIGFESPSPGSLSRAGSRLADAGAMAAGGSWLFSGAVVFIGATGEIIAGEGTITGLVM